MWYADTPEEGEWVAFDEAQAEIDSRDKRIAELATLARKLEANRIEWKESSLSKDTLIAELEAGLAEAVAKFDSWTRSEYEGTSMLAANLAELDHLRKLLP